MGPVCWQVVVGTSQDLANRRLPDYESGKHVVGKLFEVRRVYRMESTSAELPPIDSSPAGGALPRLLLLLFGPLPGQPRLEIGFLLLAPGFDAVAELIGCDLAQGVVLIHLGEEELTGDGGVGGGAVPTVFGELQSVALDRGHQSALVASLDVLIEVLVQNVGADDRNLGDRGNAMAGEVGVQHVHVEGGVEGHDGHRPRGELLVDLDERFTFLLTVRLGVLIGDSVHLCAGRRDRDVELEQPFVLAGHLTVREVHHRGGHDPIRCWVHSRGLGVEGDEARIEPPGGGGVRFRGHASIQHE